MMQSHVVAASMSSPFLINVKTLSFKVVFYLVFVCAGFLTLSNLPFRLSPIALLALPIVLRYGVKRDRVVHAYLMLTAAVLLSAIVNGVAPMKVALFMRSLVFSYLIYRLVDIYADEKTLPSLVRTCIAIGMLQLPLVIAERAFFDHLPAATSGGIAYVDIGIGTFRDDASMTFFINLLIVFLLFDADRRSIIPYRGFVIVWLILTVLLSNAEILKVTLLLALGVYLVVGIRTKVLAPVVLLGIALCFFLAFTGIGQQRVESFTNSIVGTLTNRYDERRFLEGGYARGAAIAYYAQSDILWLGDGPLNYFDPITRTRFRGNTGHIFTYYSEVGLIGLVLSLFVFYRIAFHRGRQTWRAMNALAFASVLILGFTTEILNHLSVVLIYCIMVKTYLIPPRTRDRHSSSQRVPVTPR